MSDNAATPLHRQSRSSFLLAARPSVLLGVFSIVMALVLGLVALDVFTLDLVDEYEAAPIPRWMIGLIAATFLAAGDWLLLSGILELERRRKQARLAAQRPQEPWWRDHPWDAARVRDENVARIGPAIGVGAFLIMSLVPGHWLLLQEDSHPVLLAVVVAANLIALGFVVIAVRHLLQLLRHGRSELRFVRFPFHPGQVLDVQFAMRTDLSRFREIECTLRHVEERAEARSGAAAAMRCWARHEQRQVLQTPEAMTSAVPLTFRLPDDVRAVTALSARPPRYWELEVRARARRGPDYEARFVLPVYAASVAAVEWSIGGEDGDDDEAKSGAPEQPSVQAAPSLVTSMAEEKTLFAATAGEPEETTADLVAAADLTRRR